MATVYEKLRSDIIAAVKARDSTRATMLRTADAAIQRAAMDANKPVDDALATVTLRKSVKNLTDAKAEFAKGGRADLVAANEAEILVLEAYLPQGIPAAALDAMVTEAIRTTGALSRKEMGKVIAALKQRSEAPAMDFGAINKLIQAKLS